MLYMVIEQFKEGAAPEIYRRLMASPSPASYFKDEIEEEFTPRRIG